MKRILLAILPAALLAGALALPASAEPVGGVIPPGIANVGERFTAANPCTKQGTGVVEGRGLRAPGFKGGDSFDPDELTDGTNTKGVWAIVTPIRDAAWGPGTLSACGQLKGILGGAKHPTHYGAWCGLSKGYDGQGKARAETPKQHPKGGNAHLQLSNVHWKITGGGMLPIKANWELVNAVKSKGKASNKKGKLIALVNAQGAQRCVEPGNSATLFNVVGAYLLAPESAAKPNKWNDKGPVIKTHNGAQCRLFTKDNNCYYKTKTPKPS